VRFPRRFLIFAAAVAAAQSLIPAALATSLPVADVGYLHYNNPVCTPKGFVPVDLGHGNYFNVYNSQSGNTCIITERHHLSWYVSEVRPTAESWQYPNISSGWEWSRYTCDDGLSARPGHGSQCMRYPVQEKKDGHPLTSVTYYPHLQNGNVAYDIWFNQTDSHPNQDNGTEVMIWLSHPGVHEQDIAWYTTIEGHEYEVINWIAVHNFVAWHYVAYIAVHPTRAFTREWLNPFFKDAIAHGQLSPNWWLTAIDFGSEMNEGGTGFDVHTYSLTGVR
jgi:hypothetical protein